MKKIMSLKKWKKVFILCISLLIVGFNYPPKQIMALPENSPDLGGLSHYNAVIFGNMSATRADIEGALAVEGNIEFGSNVSGYDIGSAGATFNPYQMGQYSNSNHYPSFLLGGIATHLAINHNKWVNIYNGPAVVKESYKEEFKNIPLMGFTEEVQGAQESNIKEFFKSAKATVEKTAEVLQKGNDNTISADELKNLSSLTLSKYENEYIDTNGAKTIVLNVDAHDNINIGEMNLPSSILDYEVIIINVPAKSIIFGLGEGGYIGAMTLDGHIVDTEANIHSNPQENLKVKQLAERIVWNFPNATSVSTYRYGVLGSVLAPNAHLTGDAGSINGMVVAASFMQKGGMEPHAFPIKNIWHWNVDTTRVKIIKTTQNGEIELPSEILSEMKFTIRNISNEEIETLSIENNFTSNKLNQGTYTIWEDSAPHNYQKIMEAAITFTVDNKRVINNWNGSSGVKFDTKDSFLIARINNEPIPYIEQDSHKISISKVNADTKKGISDVKFILEKEEQSSWIEQSTLISGLDGKSDWVQLAKGSYRLKEVSPAQGYLRMSDDIYFKIDTDLVLTITNKPEEVVVQSANYQTLFVIENKLDNPNKPIDPHKPKNPNTPTNPGNITYDGTKQTKNIPKTGDNAQIEFGLLILSLGVGTIIVLRVIKKDENL